MASPLSAGPVGGDWHDSAPAPSGYPQHMPTPPIAQDRDECGPQTRPMGVKVLYSLKDSADNLLARWPHVQQIQTVSLDDINSIGVIDLRVCLQAIFQCSPELFDQRDLDYTVYAFDYSEAETPLVGQGMFSWGLEAPQPNEVPKVVTGRVTKNLLGVFGGGPKETLEVKLKLAAVPRRRPRMDPSPQYSSQDMGMSHLQPQQWPIQSQQQHLNLPSASTTDTSEWNSFIESNPNLARSASAAVVHQSQQPPSRNSYPRIQGPGSRPGSASIAQGHASSPVPIPHMNYPDWARPISGHAVSRQNFPSHQQQQQQQHAQLQPLQPAVPIQDTSYSTSQSRIGTPDVKESTTGPGTKPSRPSSRTRSRVPTGRPRGRPKKKPAADGNTSGLEDPTDADDGPRRKRAKTTLADWSEDRPSLDSTADSLRVVAAISGSIRSIRPVGHTGEAVGGSHLQEGPRAPTPVPQGPVSKKARQRKRSIAALSRQDSIASTDDAMGYPNLQHESSFGMSGQHRMDARSPTESVAASEQVYTPEESPADLGSSPPVPRSSAFIRSSPVVSSPVLPRMVPNRRHDSGFMSGGIDGAMDDEEVQTLPPQKPQLPTQREASPMLPKIAKPIPRKGNNVQTQGFPFMEEIPGPQELLPQTSLYNPPRSQSHKFRQQQESSVPSTMKRANAESKPRRISVSEALFAANNFSLADTPTGADQALPSVEEPSAKKSDKARLVEKEDAQKSAEDQPLLPVPEVQNQALKEIPRADAPKGFTRGDEISHEQLQALMAAASGPAPDLPLMLPPNPSTSRPATSTTPAPDSRKPTVPASDPVGPQASLVLPLPPVSYSEAPCPPSDTLQEQTASNKNYAKKQTIKERLEQAIEQGEMPPFCSNCGAIETPTWRKMWTQDHVGSPGFHDYSEKPGLVTAIDIIERDKDENPISYRLVKKSLGPGEDKALWKKSLICNPCGIWLGKFKCHRPPEQWDKNLARLNQPRRKRDKSSSSGNGRSKKARTKSDAQLNLTSEACYMTDPLGPGCEQTLEETNNVLQSRQTSKEARNAASFVGSPNSRGPGSTHSRVSETAQSPIAVEDDLGPARRLLFPSPRKDGIQKVLGEASINIVRPGPELAATKSGQPLLSQNQKPVASPKNLDQEMVDLFGTPPVRPSTPPPNGSTGGPFKTPTRPTPSHRPITRSVSKSIRSQRTATIISPSRSLAGLQRTPSRTPGRQRPSAHFSVEELAITGLDDSPFPATLSQLLSEANEFTNGSPSHGLGDLGGFDLNSAMLDFDNVLNANMPMPSSPPLPFKESGVATYDPSWDLTPWSQHDQDCAIAEVDVGQHA